MFNNFIFENFPWDCSISAVNKVFFIFIFMSNLLLKLRLQLVVILKVFGLTICENSWGYLELAMQTLVLQEV